MRVFVTGGSGYVGHAVIQRLLESNHDVVALNRANSNRSLTLSRFEKEIQCVDGDILNTHRLQAAMKGSDAVIHLVGIIRENKRLRITMDNVHVEGTKSVLSAAKACGIKRFIHMSALGANPNAKRIYHRTKWEAELYVRASGIPFTIFRPSIIFGEGGPGPNFLSELNAIIQKSPVFPIFGDGQYCMQPVSIQTVAQAFSNALMIEAAKNQTFELGGPDVLTYEEIIRKIAEACGKRFRPIYIPVKLASIGVQIMEHFPNSKITSDELSMLLEGNTCSEDESRVYQLLQLTSVPFVVPKR